jgi:hypothetical protein
MVGIIPLSPPQKDIRYTEDVIGKPTVYFWNWLTLLYQKVNQPSGLTVVTGTFTCTLSGFSGAAPTGTINYTILGSRATGGLCSLTTRSVGITGTSNSSSFSMSGLPTIVQPVTGSPFVPCFCLNSGGTVDAEAILINGTGSIFFNIVKTSTGANPQFVGPISSGWTTSGGKGLQQGWTITYTLD